MSFGYSFELMQKIERLEPALKDVFFEVGKEIARHQEEDITKKEFNELRDIVKNLATAQERTERRVEELGAAQERLTTAQERTEKKVEKLAEAQDRLTAAQERTEKKIEELAEAQKQTEKKVEELAEAEKRTEKRLEKLVEAQEQTEKQVKELVIAQKQTVEDLKIESKKHKETREHMGGLSMSFGYTLENEAYKKLPELIARDFGIIVKEKPTRKYIRDNKGKFIEVNLFSQGEKKENGKAKTVTIIGESKSQLSKNDVDKFLRKKMKRLEGLYEDVFMVLVTHMISDHDVEAYANQKQIKLYYSYDF